MTTWLAILTLLLAILALESFGQYINRVEKPGSCSPSLRIQICSRTCLSDLQCRGRAKCCPTDCGGVVCTKAVTMKKPSQVKPGSCPAVGSSAWICSSTCKDDSDCREKKKCCKTRCGAMTCQNIDKTIGPEIHSNPILVNGVNGNSNRARTNYE